MERINMETIAIEDMTPREAIKHLKDEIARCPIKMEAIQLYAEMYEKSNQNHIETVVEFKKIKEEIAHLHKQSAMIITLLKQLIK